jgi:Fe-S cluster assembly protein SufD
MAETATRAGFTREAVEEISGLKNEPEWMRARRLEAFDTYETMPLPARNEEEWRRTDVSRLKLDGYVTFAPGGHGTAALPADLRPTDDRSARAGLLVQHNSVGAARELSDDVRAKGVIVTDLDTAVREHADLVQRYFMTEVIPVTYNKFTALHAAFWSGGTFIYVPRNVEVELPVQSVLYADAPGLGIFGHTLIVVEENARLTYVEEYSSPRTGQAGFSSAVSEFFLARGAQLRYVAMQEFSPEVTSFSAQRALAHADSNLNGLVVTVGGLFVKSNVETFLRAPGATAEMLGLYFGNETQFIDHHTLQEHIAPHTTSDLLYKGVLADRARSVFSGMIRVHPGAQKTDAYQQNRNLLLSDDARADSIPNLEIGANDVRCSHGATVAPLDEDEIFYLESRGIARPEATKIIVDGFFEPILLRIPLASIQERLRDFIDRKMGQERFKGDLE